MVIGTFFSTFGTPLLARLTGGDERIGPVKKRLVVTATWDMARFKDMQKCLDDYSCSASLTRIDLEDFRRFLIDHEEFLLRLVENPMVFEHESFTDLILALSHLTEELKARGDLSALPPSDKSHLTPDIQRAYTRLIHEWIIYMEYLKTITLISSTLHCGRTRLTSRPRLSSGRLPDFSFFLSKPTTFSNLRIIFCISRQR